jgi:hypothetical protein
MADLVAVVNGIKRHVFDNLTGHTGGVDELDGVFFGVNGR